MLQIRFLCNVFFDKDRMPFMLCANLDNVIMKTNERLIAY